MSSTTIIEALYTRLGRLDRARTAVDAAAEAAEDRYDDGYSDEAELELIRCQRRQFAIRETSLALHAQLRDAEIAAGTHTSTGYAE